MTCLTVSASPISASTMTTPTPSRPARPSSRCSARSAAKNLFLCNRQKTQFYLLMLEGEKVFKTKDLSKQLGVARLSFADPADMEKYLVSPPAPSASSAS